MIRVERPEINTRLRFVAVPKYPSTSPKSSIKRSSSGLVGWYRVTFILSIPGKEAYRSDLDAKRMMESGHSLLLVPKEASIKIPAFAQGEGNSQQVTEVIVHSNSSGEASNVLTRVLASDFIDAERITSNIVLPLLSWWSFFYDVALDITGYEIYEENTDVRKWAMGVVGKTKDFKVGASGSVGIVKPIQRTVIAAYREALNSTNVFYQFLCFYKVIEGTRKIRSQHRRDTLSAGKSYKDPAEKMPSKYEYLPIHDPLVLSLFKPYLNKKFNSILDQFRELLRNAVAHLDPMADSLIADNFDDLMKCEKALPVIKYMAREMLRNELMTDADYNGLSIP